MFVYVCVQAYVDGYVCMSHEETSFDFQIDLNCEISSSN